MLRNQRGRGVQDRVAHLAAVRLDRLGPQLWHAGKYTRRLLWRRSDLTQTVCLDTLGARITRSDTRRPTWLTPSAHPRTQTPPAKDRTRARRAAHLGGRSSS